MTPRYGGAIAPVKLSVNGTRSDLDDIRELVSWVEAHEDAGFHMKHLAIACRVDPGTVSKWKRHIRDGVVPRLDNRTRDAIAALMGRGPDTLTLGMAEAAEAMRGTVEDIEGAVRLARAFAKSGASALSLSDEEAAKLARESGGEPPAPGTTGEEEGGEGGRRAG